MTAKLTLLEFPKTPDELVQNRIDGLLDAMCATDNDFVPEVVYMLISYIEENYEGEYIWQAEMKLVEALLWWREANARD
jgi:hypothetical protein